MCSMERRAVFGQAAVGDSSTPCLLLPRGLFTLLRFIGELGFRFPAASRPGQVSRFGGANCCSLNHSLAGASLAQCSCNCLCRCVCVCVCAGVDSASAGADIKAELVAPN